MLRHVLLYIFNFFCFYFWINRYVHIILDNLSEKGGAFNTCSKYWEGLFFCFCFVPSLIIISFMKDI